MFGWFTGLQLGFKLFIVVALFASIGGTIYAGYRYIENKDEAIATLTQNNETLKTNQTKLEASNTGLETQIKNLNDQFAQNQQQLDKAMAIITLSQNRINANNQRLYDPVRKQQQLAANTANPSKALDDTNKQESCFWLHYNDLNGHCQDGTFIKD